MTLEELEKLVNEKKQPLIINRGLTPLSLLGIAFVVMKLIGYISWSWWWVLAPFWIPVVIALGLMLTLLVCLTYIAAKKDINIEESIKKTKETTKKIRNKKPKVKKDGEYNTTATEGKNE